MKKRLCLFMMSLLLLMSTGCSQVTPQAPETLVTEASENVFGSVTAIESTSRDNLNTDASNTVTDSTDNNSNTTGKDSLTNDQNAGSGVSSPGNADVSSFSDGQGAGFDNSSPDNADGGSLTDDQSEGSSDSESNSNDDHLSTLPEDGHYTSKEDVALYIHLYGHLPPNFITKKEAEALGWKGGSLEPFAPGMCIGGSRFGNYEGLLPQMDGRSYTECDIDTLGADKRGAKRIVFSNDGLIYYTEDHYNSFELLYGEVDP